jgi:hypothetical protein
VGVGVGVGLLPLPTLLLPALLLPPPLLLLPEPELGVAVVDCCVCSGIAVGIIVTVVVGFARELSLPVKASFIEAYPVKKTNIVIIDAISPIIAITFLMCKSSLSKHAILLIKQ